MSGKCTFLTEEAGYTLAETAVALALLVGVLIPVVAAAVLWAGAPQGARLAEALARAETAIEAAPASLPAMETLVDGRWRVERAASRRHDLEQAEGVEVIEVRVYAGRRPQPVVELVRLRALPPEGTRPR